ncbi:adhesive plaque matrix protein-like isoform X2 [Daphnia carinata]|uniref:adhesive plaque matrix protein-like isoform X2 n=1 Tax=Daphnia carinata TaxID=120202 RepID=UPI00257CF48D|nr:adhesive plaque matrix protein-like isoform X2 [Daphnia carinata]
MKVLILAALVTIAAARSSYPAKTYKTYEAPSYSAPAYEKPETYKAEPYSFSWDVKDEYYNDYSHSETSDGKVVTGSYRIELPDGRGQTVTYRADSNGYVADVKYDGEAKYPPPDYKPAAYSAPDYKSSTYRVPAYKPPVYKTRARY